ncbi:hypothetical protein Hanom_Chr05g00442511 [Helianthus anomalus]
MNTRSTGPRLENLLSRTRVTRTENPIQRRTILDMVEPLHHHRRVLPVTTRNLNHSCDSNPRPRTRDLNRIGAADQRISKSTGGPNL